MNCVCSSLPASGNKELHNQYTAQYLGGAMLQRRSKGLQDTLRDTLVYFVLFFPICLLCGYREGYWHILLAIHRLSYLSIDLTNNLSIGLSMCARGYDATGFVALSLRSLIGHHGYGSGESSTLPLRLITLNQFIKHGHIVFDNDSYREPQEGTPQVGTCDGIRWFDPHSFWTSSSNLRESIKR